MPEQRRINHNYAKDLRVGDVVSVNDLPAELEGGVTKHYQIRLGHIVNTYVNSAAIEYKHIFDYETGEEIRDPFQHRHNASALLITVIKSAGGEYHNGMDFKKKSSPIASKRQAVETMLKQGATHLAIARKLHMSPTTITRIDKESMEA